jgi:hypothetical protein
MVSEENIDEILIECDDQYDTVTDDNKLADCPTEEPVRVTVTYDFDLIFNFLFNQPLTLRRSTEMMMP